MERYEFTAEKQTALESLQVPFAVYQFIDRRVVTLVLSDGFCDLFGYEDRNLACHDMDTNMYQGTHPDDVARVANASLKFATDGSPYEIVYRTKKKNGTEYFIVHAMGRHVYTETGVRLAHVWYFNEGLYQEHATPDEVGINQALSNALHEESILKANSYDYLTGLPSMSHFFLMADGERDEILNRGGRPALMYIDFSGMKFFNTKYGFAEGDKLLQSFSKILSDLFSNEYCCRIGADHFVVLSELEGLEEKLYRMFAECQMMNDGKSLPVHVGIYPRQKESVHISVACDRAKLACNALRGTYESCFNYYRQDLNDDIERRQYIIENIDRAIENHWIQVYYQPIVRAVNERVCDEEALARWIDPVKGFMSPADFIPALEDASLIYKLDLYVLDQVLLKIKTLSEWGLYVVPQSINLSRSDFSVCDIVEEIRRRVDASGIGRDKITIEITESIIGGSFDFMKEQVARFRELGFPVWMDDFGSGYSSLDVLQSIPFDLIKFDMSFMRKLDEGDSGKIILTELMKMASALGVDTVCEGVETKAQVQFLQEIGCSKLQGYYFCKPIPAEQIAERYRQGIQIGFENPEEASYYEAISKVNLYDLAVIASGDEYSFQNAFNMLPMGVIEIKDDKTRFVRCNQSYKEFVKRFFGLDLSHDGYDFTKYNATFMHNIVKTCCEMGLRSFYDEKMPDGSVVHSFARRISINPISGSMAVAIAVLSITEPNEGTTYADIARALAADYYNIYVVDLDTEHYIEYTSPVGGEELAIERHGDDFFASAKKDTMTRIFDEDRETFLSVFTKENIVKELKEQGVFTTTYRLVDTGKPIYVNMKVTKMGPRDNRIIIGISIVDSQMKQQEMIEKLQREGTVYSRFIALSGEYLSLYTIDPVTGGYYEYSATDVYESLGLAKAGEDFFGQAIIDGKKAIYLEDLPMYMREFTRENILRQVKENGKFQMDYHLMVNGEPKPVHIKIVSIRENDGEKLIAGVRE